MPVSSPSRLEQIRIDDQRPHRSMSMMRIPYRAWSFATRVIRDISFRTLMTAPRPAAMAREEGSQAG